MGVCWTWFWFIYLCLIFTIKGYGRLFIRTFLDGINLTFLYTLWTVRKMIHHHCYNTSVSMSFIIIYELEIIVLHCSITVSVTNDQIFCQTTLTRYPLSSSRLINKRPHSTKCPVHQFRMKINRWLLHWTIVNPLPEPFCHLNGSPRKASFVLLELHPL